VKTWVVQGTGDEVRLPITVPQQNATDHGGVCGARAEGGGVGGLADTRRRSGRAGLPRSVRPGAGRGPGQGRGAALRTLHSRGETKARLARCSTCSTTKLPGIDTPLTSGLFGHLPQGHKAGSDGMSAALRGCVDDFLAGSEWSV
jgi:hypothetical protein